MANRWTLRSDNFGYPCALELDGFTVLHIVPGTERNMACQDKLVALLNLRATDAQRSALEDAMLREVQRG